MNTPGGLSIIVHLCVNLFFYVAKRKRLRNMIKATSMAIILGVFSLISSSAALTLFGASRVGIGAPYVHGQVGTETVVRAQTKQTAVETNLSRLHPKTLEFYASDSRLYDMLKQGESLWEPVRRIVASQLRYNPETFGLAGSSDIDYGLADEIVDNTARMIMMENGFMDIDAKICRAAPGSVIVLGQDGTMAVDGREPCFLK